MESESNNSESYTLFVGEGDFSFSANYILKKCGLKEKIIASCLNDGPLTERQKINIEIIENNGGLVLTDVDATRLECHPRLKGILFMKIIFNFPHIPGKMNIRANRQLVQNFFLSSVKVLEENGSVHVTLCRGQGGTDFEDVKRKWCDTWQVVSLAAYASLVLYKIESFNAKEFEIYKSTGFRGLQKPFRTEGALIHIFKHGKDVEMDMDIQKYENHRSCIMYKYLQDCKDIYEMFHKNPQHPVHKILSNMKAIAEQVFQPSFYETPDDLQVCCTSAPNSDSLGHEDIDFIEDYTKKLFTLFNKRRFIACASCSLCCVKIKNPFDHPIDHLIFFISNSAVAILNNVLSFIDYLKLMYPVDTGKKYNSNENSFLNNKQKMLEIVQQSNGLLPGNAQNLTNIYAKYSILKKDGLFFYSDVDIFLMNDVQEISNASETDKCKKIGLVLQYFYNSEKYTCIVFNVNKLACIKYHIRDYRTLFVDKCFYTSNSIHGYLEEVYRSPSIYPPSYVHDISFYVEEDFKEKEFFKVVRNTVGFLVKYVSLIDSYYDEFCQKQSNCYRFVYRSCDKALTKEKANTIHTALMRKVLQNSLNITLR